MSFQVTGELRNNIVALMDQVKRFENKSSSREVDVNIPRIYVFSVQSHRDFQALLGGEGSRELNVVIKPLDNRHLMKHMDRVDQLLERLVIFNQEEQSLGFMPSQKTQAPAPAIDVNLQIKARKNQGQPKQTPQFVGPVKAHQATQQDVQAMNQAILQMTLTAEAPISARETKAEQSKSHKPSPKPEQQTKASDKNKEEHKPASQRKTRVESLRETYKTEEKNLARLKQQERAMRKWGRAEETKI